jgi:sulfite reductase (NADPH) flavoprotein alpha-component
MNESPKIPYIPESAPFTAEQRAWLNGFLAGLFASAPTAAAPAPIQNGAPVKAAEPLLILFGSQTGSAESLARNAAREAAQRGFVPQVLALNDFAQARLADGGKALIISSTWGDGDPPDNAADFWSWLKAEAAPRLDKLQFAVLGLGDKNYSDFCGASKKFDERLEALGARRLAPRGECDADYERTAKIWFEGIWEKFAEGHAANGNGSTNGTLPANGHPAPLAEIKAFDKNNPFSARLLRNVLLNKPGSQKEVRHYEISLEGSGLKYEVGDALGILPENCPEVVDELLAALQCRGDEPVVAAGAKTSLRGALMTQLDILRPSNDLLTAMAAKVVGIEFAPLLAVGREEELKQWLRGRDVLDIIRLAPDSLSIDELLPLLRRLAPRLYSISSSPNAHLNEVHLTVSTVRYESSGRRRKGVCSTFLAERAADPQRIKTFVQPSHGFRLPSNSDVPIIMVGPGTGIAPFRAFLEERRVAGAKGKNWLLFGDQKRECDFLYEEQVVSWHRDGFLTRLDLAFSRDQAEKIYVQHRMQENAAELWSWLESGAHFYVCGDASRMAKDVDGTLHRIVQMAGGKSVDDARAYISKLKSDKRYQRDVY